MLTTPRIQNHYRSSGSVLDATKARMLLKVHIVADQKKWFKVWTSILSNANFAEMSLEDIGRWTLLGAAIALDGDKGSLEIPGEGKELCRILRVKNLTEAAYTLKRIKSAELDVQKVSGKKSVRYRNWYTYQEDSRRLERRSRTAQRRGEEKRSKEPPKPPVTRKTPGSSTGGDPTIGALERRIKTLTQQLDGEADETRRDRLTADLENARNELTIAQKGGVGWGKPKPGRR